MTPTQAMELYMTNDRIKEYTNKYMKKHGIIYVNDALKCVMVQEYIKYVVGGKE